MDGAQAGHRPGRLPAVLLHTKEQRRVSVFYVYIFDEQMGGGFIKICSYFPYPVKVWVNGQYAEQPAMPHRVGAGLVGEPIAPGFAA